MSFPKRRSLSVAGIVAGIFLMLRGPISFCRPAIPPPPPGGWKPPKAHLKLWNDPDCILPGEPLIVEITFANDTDEGNVTLIGHWKNAIRLQFKQVTEWQKAFPTGPLGMTAPAPPVKIPPHQRIVFRKMVRTWDYMRYWLKKPIFTPGKWKIRFCLPSWRGTWLYTNEIEIKVTFKTGQGQDEKAFQYMFGGKEKHAWFGVSENQKLYKEHPAYLAAKKEDIIRFIKNFPYSRCAKYARLQYVALTREDTDPETVRRRGEYIKQLRAMHSYTQYEGHPFFPPWLAKYYLPPDDPFLKGLKPAGPAK